MSWLEGNRLRLKAVELQLEIQKLKTQYLIYACSLFSIMIVTDVLLFIIGMCTREVLWFILALCITISFVLIVNICLERWFLTNVNELKTRLLELEKRYLL